jgi:hypothetical protein
MVPLFFPVFYRNVFGAPKGFVRYLLDFEAERLIAGGGKICLFFIFFEVCVSKDNFFVVFVYFNLKVLFEVLFKFFEKFMRNGQVGSNVVVDMFVSEVSFL